MPFDGLIIGFVIGAVATYLLQEQINGAVAFVKGFLPKNPK